MITITFQVDTDESGRLKVDANAVGIGNQRESIMALAIFDGGNEVYHALIKAAGGSPQSELSPESRITEVGQG